MAEQIIDIRERIEKMRIKIDSDVNQEQISYEKSEEKKLNQDLNNERDLENKVVKKDYDDKNVNQNNRLINDNKKEGSFPSVSLSVKNPISTKMLVVLMVLQIFSNLGILFLLYTLLE